MSDEQQPPGAGGDPGYGGRPHAGGGPGQPPGGWQGGPGPPYGGGQQPPGYGYGVNPYGGPGGAGDPLAGMPPLASRGRRLIARIVDALIVAIPVSLITATVVGPFDAADAGTYAPQALTLLVYFVYEGLMLSARGQTLGKMLMKVRVAMLADGAVPTGNPAWARAATYSLPQLVPCLGFLFWLLNVLFCTWDKPYRQCLHDKVAKTVVVSSP
ncbi:RDD family protein [Streptomyces sp. ACA25]|uniref:RDD family protein n=1 Tax=Streptomyces sp. ACA25 TaxID=3022596 RepID=UPI0023074A27|nr:RDD family protein [Streptomyces sp. ACA25]MDB1089508.1 RDD family protein [Streptomyces sp. ACA25]